MKSPNTIGVMLLYNFYLISSYSMCLLMVYDCVHIHLDYTFFMNLLALKYLFSWVVFLFLKSTIWYQSINLHFFYDLLFLNLSFFKLLLCGKISNETSMATHSSILAWRITWTEETGGLQSIGSQGIGHNWSILAQDQ